MRHTMWSLNDYTEAMVGSVKWRETNSTDTRRRRIFAVMEQVLRQELTLRQMQCIRLYYYDGKNINQIATLLQVCPSTVCRHLKKARARLSSILQYYFTPLAEDSSGLL